VPLIAPGHEFLDRISQLDLRFAKTVKIGNARVKGLVDFFNVFNANPVLSVNSTFGAAWLRPTAVLPGRLVKIGGQFNF
jgi:hypothetical protein